MKQALPWHQEVSLEIATVSWQWENKMKVMGFVVLVTIDVA
jgi:hypothetical protein